MGGGWNYRVKRERARVGWVEGFFVMYPIISIPLLAGRGRERETESMQKRRDVNSVSPKLSSRFYRK